MTQRDKANIRQIMEDPKYQSLLVAANTLLDEWKNMSCVGENSYDTVKLTLMREFKIKGLKEYLDKLERSFE